MIAGMVCVALVGLGLGITSVRAAAPDNYQWVEHNNGLSGIYVAGFAVDPTATSTMYVLLLNKGIYKSIDGGATWNPANGTYPNNFPYTSGIEWYGFMGNALTINPYNPQILYANAGGEFYETTNGGGSWANINGNITICAPNYQGAKIVVDPTSSTTLFATDIAAGCDGGLYESTTTSSTPSWVRVAGPGINSLPK